MIIGKQSNLNDLQDLKTHLEAKIAAAADIKISEVSRIESGTITSVSDPFAARPSGIYYAEGIPELIVDDSSYGMLVQMQCPVSDFYSVALYGSWRGNFKALVNLNGANSIIDFLTSQNTITDSNGFIKTA